MQNQLHDLANSQEWQNKLIAVQVSSANQEGAEQLTNITAQFAFTGTEQEQVDKIARMMDISVKLTQLKFQKLT